MHRAGNGAMEWALALLRTPSRRHALRQMDLPGGMDRLLAVAGGHASGEALESMVHAFGEPAERLIEAARFYAREVLFFPEADAYRVLGVSAEADPDLIKLHHRLLQQWLHPDRPGGRDDAVFAARVNAAWNALRTEERRIAYRDRSAAIDDVRQEHLPSMEADAGPIWVPATTGGSAARWHQWVPMSALVLVCLVLVWLVLRDMQRSPDGASWKEPSVDEGTAENVLGLRVPEPKIPTQPDRLPVKSAPVATAVAAVSAAPSPYRAVLPHQVATVAESGIVDMGGDRVESLSSDSFAAAPTFGTPLPKTPPIALSTDQEAPPSAVLPSGGDVGAARIQLARQTGQALVRYMDNPVLPPPPIWNSPAMQASADALRQELQGFGDGRLQDIQWRFAQDAAVLTADYRLTGGLDGQVPVRLVVDIVWREQQWLVTGVSMVRSR